MMPYFIQPIHPDNEPGSRSVNGDKAVKLIFINNRASAVRLWWLDYNGKRVDYGTVGDGEIKEMDTYVTHPWVLVDESSGSVLGIFHPGPRTGRVILI
ncbi:hypothetical protein Dda_6330 [Drechslerella dactyloides]|uniref:von Hippel-Lindau disease tumour suppressor beta domain-containing protein n=1 Tax=Drechslerella dactyloides TaxID=74499 RepID=A0AAD6IVE0_DREDA|nr:hypothetical protein Dda_6330 [Drechslerella dactyloides]